MPTQVELEGERSPSIYPRKPTKTSRLWLAARLPCLSVMLPGASVSCKGRREGRCRPGPESAKESLLYPRPANLQAASGGGFGLRKSAKKRLIRPLVVPFRIRRWPSTPRSKSQSPLTAKEAALRDRLVLKRTRGQLLGRRSGRSQRLELEQTVLSAAGGRLSCGQGLFVGVVTCGRRQGSVERRLITLSRQIGWPLGFREGLFHVASYLLVDFGQIETRD